MQLFGLFLRGSYKQITCYEENKIAFGFGCRVNDGHDSKCRNGYGYGCH
ncbi:hypothetical protein Barb6_00496 [Bacteroidales bacterium Barb6]|nr:hypothetical protein Barb6_00496 [Bacteroidales bacterium Barb6]